MAGTALSPGAFTEGAVQVGRHRVRYREGGRGEPLAIVHGDAGPAEYAAGTALGLLARDRHVIAFELPASGQSGWGTRTPGGPVLAATLAGAMAALGVGAYPVLGTSAGATVALWWAARFPDRVTSVVLESPLVFRTVSPRPAGLDPAAPQDWDRTAGITGPDRDAAVGAHLETLKAPVLVLIGSRDGIISADEGRHYVQAIPDCYFIVVYDAAHDLQGDRPEAFAQVVTDFLTHGPNFTVNHHSTVISP